MKNIVKTLGLTAIIALSSGCNNGQEKRIMRNPALKNIYNDGMLAVYEDYKKGINKPNAFVYAKDLEFCYHSGKPVTYPAAGRIELPHLELKEKGKATLHLKYNQALVVSDISEVAH